MPLSVPPELKKITPFVRRAEELDKDKNNPESRLVSYYCRQYAVHTGIPLAATSANAKVCLGSLLEALEQEKPAMDNFTKEEAKYVCAEFANKVFAKANDEDVNGLATKDTAKTFYAAASFLQILEQFDSAPAEGAESPSEEQEETKKKMLYAKWKATEILKAIKEGRTPTPGGYEENKPAEEEEIVVPPTEPKTNGGVTVVENDDDDSVEDVTPPSAFGLPPPAPSMAPPSLPTNVTPSADDDEGTEVALDLPPPAYPGPPSAPSEPEPPAFPMPPPPPSAPPVLPTAPAPPQPAATSSKKSVGSGMFGFGKKKNNGKGGKVSKEQLNDAIELTKFALVALEDKNADIGAERLQQALQALGR